MQNRVNLISLYQQAFGYIAPPYFRQDATDVVPKASPFDEQTLPDLTSELKSFFGTPIFMPCKLQISKIKDELEYWTLPNEPLIEVSGSKKIIETEIDGKDGTFKELFSMKDYNVVIRGIAVDDNNTEEYPEDQVRRLRAIYELRNSLKIVAKLPNLFGIDRVSIVELRLPPVEGVIEWQPYEFICKSDREFNLELKSKNG